MTHKQRQTVIPKLMSKLKAGKITKKESKTLTEAMTAEVMLKLRRKRRGF